MTPVSVIAHYQRASLRDHRCFCPPSITLFLSLIFLKTLVSSLHNRDIRLCCKRNRNKLYVKFALEGSEVIGLAITPAFLTNSWRPREARPSWVLLQQRAVIHCQWAQCCKAGQLPSWRKGRAQNWQACQCKCQSSWTWRKRRQSGVIWRENHWEHPKRQCLSQQPPVQEKYSHEVRDAILAAFCTVSPVQEALAPQIPSTFKLMSNTLWQPLLKLHIPVQVTSRRCQAAKRRAPLNKLCLKRIVNVTSSNYEQGRICGQK